MIDDNTPAAIGPVLTDAQIEAALDDLEAARRARLAPLIEAANAILIPSPKRQVVR